MISKKMNENLNSKKAQLYYRKDFMTEKEINTLMEEIINETNISELSSKEGIDDDSYLKWSKDFIRIVRGKLVETYNEDEISSEIIQLKNENLILSKLVDKLSKEIQSLKTSLESSNRVN